MRNLMRRILDQSTNQSWKAQRWPSRQSLCLKSQKNQKDNPRNHHPTSMSSHLLIFFLLCGFDFCSMPLKCSVYQVCSCILCSLLHFIQTSTQTYICHICVQPFTCNFGLICTHFVFRRHVLTMWTYASVHSICFGQPCKQSISSSSVQWKCEIIHYQYWLCFTILPAWTWVFFGWWAVETMINNLVG